MNRDACRGQLQLTAPRTGIRPRSNCESSILTSLVDGEEGFHARQDVVVDMAMEEPDARVIRQHLHGYEGPCQGNERSVKALLRSMYVFPPICVIFQSVFENLHPLLSRTL